MKKQYHILNGDALKERFPKQLQGTILIARECLVDGDVAGTTLAELFATRARFLRAYYDVAEQDYYEKTVPEFLKISKIDTESDINLWFEEDLFCQVNFWFITHLLTQSDRKNKVYLIRPTSPNQYSFGRLTQTELLSIYKNRVLLTDLPKIASLWLAYQQDDLEKLRDTAQVLEATYPFILPAVAAHIARKPSIGNRGRPTEALIAIMNELETEEFGPVFRAFTKRESIYGFGDLQVKRLFDRLVTKPKQ